MIRRACYVACDLCGDPAPVTTLDAKDARNIAREHGWKRTLSRDICPRHIVWTRDGHGHRRWHVDAWLPDEPAASPEAAKGGGE